MLLLRTVVGGTSASLGILYASGLIARTATVWVAASALIVGGVAMLIGFLTPIASLSVALCVLGVGFSWFPAPPLALWDVRLLILIIVLTAVGVGLLGPGAFSIDGRLFGRREIVIPPQSREP